ncbi:2-C-methyl-D-erythritol 4-phosphate cytidylyltransferase [Chloroflexota bacterium]
MKSEQQARVGIIIAAAGESQRMGGVDKILATIGGEPLLIRATGPFQKCALVNQIVVVVSSEKEDQCRHLVTGEEWSKVSDVCLGGKRRQDSVAAGLKRLKDCDWVIIHDGARPLVTADLIEQGLEAVRETGAAIAAVPVTDTIKMAGNDNIVQGTPPRQNLWAVQTPQVFRFDIITRAYDKAHGDVTDDATLVEQRGHRVKLYMGSYDNIKVTTPEDLAIAEVLWQKIKKDGK